MSMDHGSQSVQMCMLEGKVMKCISKGKLPVQYPGEEMWNKFVSMLMYVSIVLTGLLAIPICTDILLRHVLVPLVRAFIAPEFNIAIDGIIEIETMSLVPIAFCATGFLTISRQHIQIDIFFDMFNNKLKSRLILLANLVCLCTAAFMTYETFEAAMSSDELTPTFYVPLAWLILITTLGFATACVGFLYQTLHSLADLKLNKDFIGILAVVGIIALIIALPFGYKAYGVKVSGLVIGGVGFVILFSLLLLRVPIAFAMAFIGVLGLICLKRTVWAAFSAVGEIPYQHTADFVFVAIPMFMLMGELAFYSGISADLFECANRWLGRLPGGLAAATIGGCAGFGAVCGESLPTVITMSSVALPPMRERNYDTGLATGALAAGGTLGILIPPSIGFIFYSIITEESIGKLFIAGIIPGILLSSMFIGCIVFQVKRNPSLAPKGEIYTMQEKLSSLVLLLPMIGLFALVVGGILQGWFTPGEGGAVGTMGAFLYSACRRRVSWKILKDSLTATVTMTGKIFLIFAGVYCFGAFLAASRLPNLLAETIISLDVNRYVVLAIIVALYIALGAVMNILPMMLLTLPSIYPTVQALGFDGIWFGVITVMLMEMGLITPPVGMNVFTLSSLAPDIPMATIFRGVMPFFLTMVLCVTLIIMFPPLATWLPNLLI